MLAGTFSYHCMYSPFQTMSDNAHMFVANYNSFAVLHYPGCQYLSISFHCAQESQNSPPMSRQNVSTAKSCCSGSDRL